MVDVAGWGGGGGVPPAERPGDLSYGYHVLHDYFVGEIS